MLFIRAFIATFILFIKAFIITLIRVIKTTYDVLMDIGKVINLMIAKVIKANT